MHLLTVGEMARLNHVSEQTLRLYDREGLLCPCVRKENGYRYYDIKQSVELDVIQYMKSLGISLKEIRQQLKTRDIEGVERALRDRDRQLMEEMRAPMPPKCCAPHPGKLGFLPFGSAGWRPSVGIHAGAPGLCAGYRRQFLRARP